LKLGTIASSPRESKRQRSFDQVSAIATGSVDGFTVGAADTTHPAEVPVRFARAARWDAQQPSTPNRSDRV